MVVIVIVVLVVEAVRIPQDQLVLQPSRGKYSGSEHAGGREIKVSE